MNKKMTFVCGMTAFLISSNTFGQIKNYDKTFNSTNAVVEKVTVKLIPGNEKQVFPALILTGLATTVPFVVDIVKTLADKNAKSYTGSYSGTTSANDVPLFFGSDFGHTISVKRQTCPENSSQFEDQSEFILKFEPEKNGGLFRLKMEKLAFQTSKAKVKSDKSTLELLIEVNLTANYLTNFALKTDSVSLDQIIKTVTYEQKASDLGTSSIALHNVKVGDTISYAGKTDPELYSGWFQMVPNPYITEAMRKSLKTVPYDKCWVTAKVTIKEANPKGIKAVQFAEFMTTNAENISNFLKGWIPVPKD